MTAGDLRRLVHDDPDAAVALFDGRLAFGTAGLRAPLGPGPTRMNRVVVRQTTAGLMSWLEGRPRPVGRAGPGGADRGVGATVVVGYDARHRSAEFAADTADVVARCGGVALVLPEPLPTPVLAHAVLHLGADAGVMITASHNPATDNGYKLYLDDGIQLVAPADREIAAAIDVVAAGLETGDPLVAARTGLAPGGAGSGAAGSGAAEGPVGGIGGDGPGEPSGRVEILGPEVAEAHLEAAVAACVTRDRTVDVVYTALHGVGGRHLLAAFERAGFDRPAVVAAQFEPDPDFPTVAFPNPEEAGVLDLAVREAAERAADLVVANDPDADRLAVALPARDGTWVTLTGDQVGTLLALHLLGGPGREQPVGPAGRPVVPGGERPDRPLLVASSIVSSRMISAVAADREATDVRTLTGFKWVARPIVERPDHRYVLGYEEALGYCIGDRVRDKDGISAALVLAELVAACKAGGRTPWDLLDEAAARYGVHLTGPVTLRFEGDHGSDRRAALMERVLIDPPVELAGVAVTGVEDLSLGRHLPATTGLVWDLADRSRVLIRPSGTEPKLKAYLEVIEPVDGAAVPKVADARDRASERLDRLGRAVRDLLSA